MALSLSALLLAATLATPAPYVEVRASRGVLDGPGGGPAGLPVWDRLRLEVDVQNHLDVAVSQVVLDVVLMERLGAETVPIPGWSFLEVPVETDLAPTQLTTLTLAPALPARRRALAAENVAYDVRIRSYRVSRPNPRRAFQLLGSTHASDQRAALASFESDPATPLPDEVLDELLELLDGLPNTPSATDALRMLMAVRATGILGDPKAVPALLALPDRLDREVWGRALLALASRMVVASGAEDPRLLVLPRWARRVATLLRVNARDAVEEVTREAVRRIGVRAVPALVRATGGRRFRAEKILARMGRATTSLQLDLPRAEDRRAVMRIFAVRKQASAVPALIERMVSPRTRLDAPDAERALEAIGESALPALAEALGIHGDRVVPILRRLGARYPRALAEVARNRFQFDPTPFSSAAALVDAIAERSLFDRRTRLETEVQDAIGLGAEGAYRAALERLDAVYAEDPELYLRNADPIARLYVARAEKLLERGDYDAALAVLADGRSVKPLPETDMRMTDAYAALAGGYLQLGGRHLETARRHLEEAPVPQRADVASLWVRWYDAATRRALSRGRIGEARRFVDRARGLAPARIDLRILDRRVMLAEHLAEVLVLALTIPALVLAAAVFIRRRLERWRLERLAREIDQPEA